jgi:hypothetical protein
MSVPGRDGDTDADTNDPGRGVGDDAGNDGNENAAGRGVGEDAGNDGNENAAGRGVGEDAGNDGNENAAGRGVGDDDGRVGVTGFGGNLFAVNANPVVKKKPLLPTPPSMFYIPKGKSPIYRLVAFFEAFIFEKKWFPCYSSYEVAKRSFTKCFSV